MKLKLFFLAVFPLTLLGCQSSIPINKDIDPAKSSVIQQNKIENPKDTLSSYKWYLENDEISPPIELTLSKDGKLFIRGYCNYSFSGYEINEDKMIFPNVLAQTLAACFDVDGKLINSQEKLSSRIFDRGQALYTLNMSQVDEPILTIKKNNEQVIFKGKMTLEAKYKTQPDIIYLEISPKKQPCVAGGNQTCMLVREIKYNDKGLRIGMDENWTLFHDKIEGFEHNIHTAEIVRLKRFKIKKPTSDQFQYIYVVN